MSYEKKYLKYKQKYLQLKLELEGGVLVNPLKLIKREPKGTDSSDLQKYLTDRNNIINEINAKKAEITAKQNEINKLKFDERQAFKKAKADAKLEAAKAKIGGGLNLLNKIRGIKVPKSEELNVKKEELQSLQSELKELLNKLDNLNNVIKTQEKADHYEKKIAKTQQ